LLLTRIKTHHPRAQVSAGQGSLRNHNQKKEKGGVDATVYIKKKKKGTEKGYHREDNKKRLSPNDAKKTTTEDKNPLT